MYVKGDSVESGDLCDTVCPLGAQRPQRSECRNSRNGTEGFQGVWERSAKKGGQRKRSIKVGGVGEEGVTFGNPVWEPGRDITPRKCSGL